MNLAAMVAGSSAPAQNATLVLTGGDVWTGLPGHPLARAVAVRDDAIIAVGSEAEILGLAGPTARRIALRGRLLVPGLMDSHTHFLDGGFQLAGIHLRTVDSPAEFAHRVREFAATRPPGAWITGGDWDHERWPDSPLPTHEWIDPVSADHPVFVSRLDGQMGVANALALRLAGITRDSPDPPGGTIVRDPVSGEPTGVLKDDAMTLVLRVVPKRGDAGYDEALARAQTHALSHGVTHVTDMADWDDLAAFQRARDRGNLTIRVHAFVQIAGWQRLRDYVAEHGLGDDLLRWGGLKAFVDGSLGSHTAWFHEPYSDAPNDRGLQVTDTASLRQWILDADAAGLYVAVHAIGDAANDWILDVFQEAEQRNGPRDRRFRIEHAQHLTPAAIPRFAELEVLASMQPYHAIDDGRWAEKRIGAARARTTYAFRSLSDAGARLMFGSDWTVAPLRPILGIYAAVTRRTLDGRNPGGWVPQEKISVEQALQAYTANAAFGAWEQDRLGTIEVGKLADLVVLSQDILHVEPGRIPDTRVDYTIVGGSVAHQRDAGEAP
jgi:predicted amidohydrolase YtcJ